jgi:hypothetical protein
LALPEESGAERGRPNAAARLLLRAGLDRLKPILLDPKVVSGALLALAIIDAVQEYLLGPKVFGGVAYTHVNNFRIYEQSFRHLVQGQDLYLRYPTEYWDVFKYSPTFAALMAPFSLLPEVVGVVLWNLLNAGVLALALARITALPARSRALVGWFVLPEAVTAFQNLQVNVLLAGLVVLTYVSLEEDRPERAALFLMGATFVKVYPAAAVALVLLYPRKRRFLLWVALWLVILGALPLLYVSPEQLGGEYRSWLRRLATDHSELTGISVAGILRSWFGLDPRTPLLALLGAALGLLPLLRTRLHQAPRFRLSFAGSLLIWMVIFNHTAESATYAIAVVGVALAYFAGPRRPVDRVLLAFVFALTSMSPRFPLTFIHQVVQPLALKALPCILFWAATVRELLTRPYRLGVETLPLPGARRPLRRVS